MLLLFNRNTNIQKTYHKSNSYSFDIQKNSYFCAFSDGGVAEPAATFGGRVHPRTRAGGGARWIRVLRSRTKKTMGGAEVSVANGVPTKVGCQAARSRHYKKKRG